MNNLELAWAAGFFDGEGCVSLSSDRYSVRVDVGQVERQPLDRFQAAVGMGRINDHPLVPPRKNAIRYWRLSRREDVHLLCWMLWPYLSEPKRRQFEEKFAAYHAVKIQRKARARTYSSPRKNHMRSLRRHAPHRKDDL